MLASRSCATFRSSGWMSTLQTMLDVGDVLQQLVATSNSELVK
jgi:hypothetical protein